MKMHQQHSNHYIIMFCIMILSGLLSTMNVYADKLDDIRWSLNDIYMTTLMTGWMLTFMSIYYKDVTPFIVGSGIVIFSFYAIRTQLFISQDQYLLGMIPHHSMAILMSKRLLTKDNSITPFLNKIITTQIKEIEYMKQFNRGSW
jgi:hypothetical protein